jgi:predicted SprT family Zn-dependent metalloprotease
MAKKEENKKEQNKKYQNANDEFQPLLQQIFQSNQENTEPDKHLPINVEPEKIICLRMARGGGSKYAYIRPIRGEYALLTEAKYFLVICNENYDFISVERQKYVILHEYCHTHFDISTQKYETLDHNIKDFSFLLKNPEWNTDLVKDLKYESKSEFGKSTKGETAK